MKLLSVAIPCYNSENYMRHCIESLLPGGDEVEILIVDDGSTKDKTGEIADEYEKKYPGICRAIHQENGGHGEAGNAGLRNATGIYFKVVDSDDWVNHQNLIFDVVVPHSSDLTDEEVKSRIAGRMGELPGGPYFAVVSVDRSYAE